MKYLILKKPDTSPGRSYRGTYRCAPDFVGNLSEIDPVNQAFLNYLRISDETGALTELEEASRLVEEYKKVSPPQNFEIVRVTEGGFLGEAKSKLIGFDISSANFLSILEFIFDHDPSKDYATAPGDRYWTIVPLINLMQEHFRPFLNSNGLFSDFGKAEFFMSCTNALRSVVPDLWEDKEIDFKVLGLWEID